VEFGPKQRVLTTREVLGTSFKQMYDRKLF
jgi:hypothetical protein